MSTPITVAKTGYVCLFGESGFGQMWENVSFGPQKQTTLYYIEIIPEMDLK